MNAKERNTAYVFQADAYENNEGTQEEDAMCPYCDGTYIADAKNGLKTCLECGNQFTPADY